MALLPDPGPVVPTIVYTGPTRTPAQVDALAAVPEAADPAPKKSKKKAAKSDVKAAAVTPAAPSPAPGGATVTGQGKTGKPTGSTIHYTPSSSAAQAVSPQPIAVQKKPKPVAPAQ
jgi:D-alanyl-D-alanine carboxypeptidase